MPGLLLQMTVQAMRVLELAEGHGVRKQLMRAACTDQTDWFWAHEIPTGSGLHVRFWIVCVERLVLGGHYELVAEYGPWRDP